MTLTQLEYIIAVADCSSFAKASEKCFVTQPTLSMQIKKLERELNVVLFDRRKKPVRPTAIGLQVIEQARVSLSEVGRIHSLIEAKEGECGGELRLGIIPTLSPYLMPLFVIDFVQRFPNIRLTVKEIVSEGILYGLHNDQLDLGLMVAPTENKKLKKVPLFYEPFVAYIATDHLLSNQTELTFTDLDLNNMWLLKEGHCFRDQVVNICGEDAMKNNKNSLRFESGSLETLRRIVEQQYGYTLLPELATLELNEQQYELVKEFSNPKPVREISLVMNRNFMKRKMAAALQEVILEHIPSNLKQKGKGKVVDWRR